MRHVIIGGLLYSAVLGLIFAAAVWSSNHWNQYAAENHCRATGQTKESLETIWICDAKGCVPSFYVSYKTEYQCNGNKRIWR